MKITIYVNSKSGFTKKYAEWIKEEIDCEIKKYKEIFKTKPGADDIFIFGSRLFAGKIQYLEKVKKHIRKFPEKKFIVFVSGASPQFANDIISTVWKTNFTEAENASIPHFYMQSGLNYEKMGFAEKLLMKTAARLMNAKKDKAKNDVNFAEALSKSFDMSKKEYIMPLVKYLKENC